MKKLGAIIILISLTCIFLHSCNDGSDSNIQQQSLRVALYDNPTNLDPRTYADAVSYRVIELVYDFLVQMDSTGKPQLSLARQLETPSDTVYVFTLYRNVRFHDGSPLTAHDVAYTFNSILDPALNAPLRNTLENIRRIEVLDSFKIKFSMKEPHAPFLSDLQVGIVPKHLVETGQIDLKRNPVGSGPFKFVKWDADAVVELSGNENYWKGAPHLNEIELKILPEATTRILALENREVDFLMNNFPLTYLPQLKDNDKLKIMKEPGSNYVYLGLNQQNEYLKHQKVRQAIAYAMNIESMIENLYGGIHTRANSLLNKNHWAYHPDLQTYDYDPDKARLLLDEAGFPDPDGDGPQARFGLVYKCSDKLQSRQKAQVVQQDLKDVGIDVSIRSYEWGTFFDDIQNGRFDMYSLSIVGIYEPAIYRRFFHSASIKNSKNRIAYRNVTVDSLIDLAERTLDNEKRKKYYWKIQEIVQRELPYISLWHETNIAVMDRRLTGFEIYPAGEWRSFYQLKFRAAMTK